MTFPALYLGVNIDHIATLRQARGTSYPDPVAAARVCEAAGADGITVHLREDRRHIQAHDVLELAKVLKTRMNLELAVTSDMIDFALKVCPAHACLVPERREELTTEGGLDVAGQFTKISQAVTVLGNAGIDVSLFIDPDKEQIDAAHETGARTIELHTGAYAEAVGEQQARELRRIIEATRYAAKRLTVNAGHGLNLENVEPIAAIVELNELNIGHAIIADSVFVGLYEAVRQMRQAMDAGRAKGLALVI